MRVWNIETLRLLLGVLNSTATLDNNLAVSSKAKYTFNMQCSTILLGIYPREVRSIPHKNLYIIVHRNFMYNNQKQPKCPTIGEFLSKLWHTYSAI